MKLWKKIVLIVSTLIMVLSSMILPIFADSGMPATGDQTDKNLITVPSLSGAKLLQFGGAYVYDLESSLVTNDITRPNQATRLVMSASDMRNTNENAPTLFLDGSLIYYSELQEQSPNKVGIINGDAVRIINLGIDIGEEEKINYDTKLVLSNIVIPSYNNVVPYMPYLFLEPSIYTDWDDDEITAEYKIEYYVTRIDEEDNEIETYTETVDWTQKLTYDATNGTRIWSVPWAYNEWNGSTQSILMANVLYDRRDDTPDRALTWEIAVKEMSVEVFFTNDGRESLLPELSLTAFRDADNIGASSSFRALKPMNDFADYWNTVSQYIRQETITAVEFNGDFWSFIQRSISGFFDFEVLPNVSIGAIFITLVSILLFILILKVFAGG